MIGVAKLLFVVMLLFGLNWVAQSNPRLAGWIAAAPIVSLLSVALLLMDGADNQKVATFMTGVLYGPIPNLIFLVGFIALLLRGVSLVPALGFGVCLRLGHRLYRGRQGRIVFTLVESTASYTLITPAKRRTSDPCTQS